MPFLLHLLLLVASHWYELASTAPSRSGFFWRRCRVNQHRERIQESSIPTDFQQRQSPLLELLIYSSILLHHDLRQLQHACVAAAAPASPSAPATSPGFSGSATSPSARADVPRFGSATAVGRSLGAGFRLCCVMSAVFLLVFFALVTALGLLLMRIS